MKIFSETPSYGTRLPFAGMSKPLAHGVHAWRQRPTGLPVSAGTARAIGVITTDNCTRVSTVERRHT